MSDKDEALRKKFEEELAKADREFILRRIAHIDKQIAALQQQRANLIAEHGIEESAP